MAEAKPKRTYQLSTAERARRAAQKRLRAAKKKAEKKTKQAEAQRSHARELEKTIGKFKASGRRPAAPAQALQ